MATGSGNGNEGVLRRMVNLVASPGREGGPVPDAPSSQLADVEKAELKAMIERKRRNDFVRKREFDMLRRIRREGLGAEGAQLAENSHIDSDIRPTLAHNGPDRGVKAKIDAIERQMVGGATTMPMPTRPPRMTPAAAPAASSPPIPPTLNSRLDSDVSLPATVPMTRKDELNAPGNLMGGTRAMELLPDMLPPTPRHSNPVMPPAPAARPPLPPGGIPMQRPAAPPVTAQRPAMPPAAPARPPVQVAPPPAYPPRPAMAAPVAPPRPPLPPAPPVRPLPPAVAAAPARAPAPVPPAPPPARMAVNVISQLMVEVSEIAHDHELDEAVIAFANADFTHCERVLTQLTSRNGSRHSHPDTWLVLFDFYRATGQQPRFDTLTLDYVQHFQTSGPQWFSLPKLMAEATAHAPQRSTSNSMGWLCPGLLTVEAVGQLHSHTLQLPQPWLMDWTPLKRIEPDAAERLRVLFKQWASNTVQLRWAEPERLLSVLADSSPAGMRDVDPAVWLARLEALRLINRADQFDEVAIDYCVTYEVSPPSWEPARCTLKIGGDGVASEAVNLSVLGEVVTTMEGAGDGDSHAVTSLELSGQLSGDISHLLNTLDAKLHESHIVHISCALLIRVDFIAAGDLLNWVIAKKAESRHVSFTEVHRLVALMFGAMGITEHARVMLRQA